VEQTTINAIEQKILVVDDEEFVLNLAVRILNKLDYLDVSIANNGQDAINQLHSSHKPFDIVICDLNMPEMDGVEFIHHVAERGFIGGVILLSGEDERMLETAHNLAKSQDLNVLGTLNKPIKPGELKALLGQQIHKQKRKQYPSQAPISVAELSDGMIGEELQLVYQPKVHVKSGEINAVETLARWQHKERGILDLGAFIPLAEQTGLIDDLTDAIYKKAVNQIREWLANGIQLKTSINFSINTFSRKGFTEFITGVAEEAGVASSSIMLEVTESQVMHNAINVLEIMMRLRMKRFGLSIDDFGTGQSSMVQLKDIPFTELKIDRAFVFGAAKDSSARAILESSVGLAKKLKIEVVAEGVETREDWDLVEQLGCNYVQGYYCAKPMPNRELLSFMENWTGPH
jgi:EAL domain-containing protein (putative c-di-GMP-specific phosphodiesterase class I)